MLSQTVLVTVCGEGGKVTVDGLSVAVNPGGTMLVERDCAGVIVEAGDGDGLRGTAVWRYYQRGCARDHCEIGGSNYRVGLVETMGKAGQVCAGHCFHIASRRNSSRGTD